MSLDVAQQYYSYAILRIREVSNITKSKDKTNEFEETNIPRGCDAGK